MIDRVRIAVETALFVFQLFSRLPAAIKAVEEAMPGQGQGELKLRMVRLWIEAAVEAADGLALSFEDLWPKAQSVIGDIVASFNESGEFEKPRQPE
ncbi:MAG: hypothetical protein V2J42_14105 [Wenzhouxiangella sp.]|jgi:hypothetical protein|nr:hypothetical protein [Wenzhouxiangella sp.]